MPVCMSVSRETLRGRMLPGSFLRLICPAHLSGRGRLRLLSALARPSRLAPRAPAGAASVRAADSLRRGRSASRACRVPQRERMIRSADRPRRRAQRRGVGSKGERGLAIAVVRLVWWRRWWPAVYGWPGPLGHRAQINVSRETAAGARQRVAQESVGVSGRGRLPAMAPRASAA